MLTGLHPRARQGLALPGQAWPETDGPQIIALPYRDPESRTVSLILDTTTANAAHADEAWSAVYGAKSASPHSLRTLPELLSARLAACRYPAPGAMWGLGADYASSGAPAINLTLRIIGI